MRFLFHHWKSYAVLFFLLLLSFPLLFWSRPGEVPAFTNEDGEPRALFNVKTSEPHLALAFSLEWGEDTIRETLTILEEHEVPATFFVSGEWAERHPDLLEKIHAARHEIGTVGYKGKRFSTMSDTEMRNSLSDTSRIFEKLDFSPPSYFYPPDGSFDENLLRVAEEEGLDTVYGSIHPPSGSGASMAEHILFNTGNGDIIHLSTTDEAKGLPKALQMTLPVLKEQGYEFHTISSLASGMDMKIKKP